MAMFKIVGLIESTADTHSAVPLLQLSVEQHFTEIVILSDAIVPAMHCFEHPYAVLVAAVTFVLSITVEV
jgi:hypothetical protein